MFAPEPARSSPAGAWGYTHAMFVIARLLVVMYLVGFLVGSGPWLNRLWVSGEHATLEHWASHAFFESLGIVDHHHPHPESSDSGLLVTVHLLTTSSTTNVLSATSDVSDASTSLVLLLAASMLSLQVILAIGKRPNVELIQLLGRLGAPPPEPPPKSLPFLPA